MDAEDLNARLATEGIVPLRTSEWEAVRGAFPERARHDTHLAGDLTIVEGRGGPVAVEEPSSGERVLRTLEESEVDTFVKDRLDTYERMWDGCGCRVEYYRR